MLVDLLHVEGDAALAPIRNLVEWIGPGGLEVQHVLQSALGISRRRFDLDHVGPEIGEDRAGGRDESPGGDF